MAHSDLEELAEREQIAKAASAKLAFERARADELFEKFVDTIQTREGCDRSRAYALAAHDDLAQAAYNLGIEKQRHERVVRRIMNS